MQLDEKTFGNIELAEITDEVSSNVILFAKEKSVFLARVIDQDKKGKLMLSARQSIVDEVSWKHTRPEGASAHFQQMDVKNQRHGNLRNKILKFGGKVAITQGDLFLGYIANINKAGCFVQIGHNSTVRVGLNELSDSANFDFREQMPIGRIVVGRITKCEQDNTRFSGSLRRSIVIYGVHQVDKAELQTGAKISAIVLALAEGVAFGQLKGSYHKLKIKGAPAGTQVGSLCEVSLLKVTKEKIVGDYLNSFVETDSSQQQEEHRAQQVFDSVQEEAAKDIKMAKNQRKADGGQATLLTSNQDEVADVNEIIKK